MIRSDPVLSGPVKAASCSHVQRLDSSWISVFEDEDSLLPWNTGVQLLSDAVS